MTETTILKWEYRGPDSFPEEREEWVLCASDCGDIAKFVKPSPAFMKDNLMGSPFFVIRAGYRKVLLWGEIIDQFDNGKALFELSDSGVTRVDFREVPKVNEEAYFY